MEIKVHQQGELSLEAPSPVAQPKPQRILRLAQVRLLTGLCRSSIYQLQAQRRFPQRVKIGPRAVGWVEDEVQSWLLEKIAASRGGEIEIGRS